MKTIGMLGGMSWESTALYYRIINEETKRKLGGLHSAPVVLVSVDFQEIETLQMQGDWVAAADLLAEAARRVENGGADFLMICTNTMHKVADEVAEAVDIPLLHLADAAAERIADAGFDTVGLLGTRFTMEHDFYKGRLQERGINVLTPPAAGRELVHRVIYEELCLGIVRDESRAAFLEVMDDLVERGAQAVVEGCTEIGMLVNEEHTDIVLFDTARIHAERAVALALEGSRTR
ncbi:MAG: aspartate/glutamate racemase family protein [Woeseiaceae bacterium]|nr:aspartate/glutamate racemase family protein [Woeseiaceae bacterium]